MSTASPVSSFALHSPISLFACHRARPAPRRFLTAYPPSTTSKAWIATEHEERKRMIEVYYTTTVGGAPTTDKAQVAAARKALAESSALERLLDESNVLLHRRR